MQDWGNSDPSTFIVLKEGTDIQQVNGKLKISCIQKIRIWRIPYLHNDIQTGIYMAHTKTA
jgi:hypothetical protein